VCEGFDVGVMLPSMVTTEDGPTGGGSHAASIPCAKGFVKLSFLGTLDRTPC